MIKFLFTDRFTPFDVLGITLAVSFAEHIGPVMVGVYVFLWIAVGTILGAALREGGAS